VQEALKTWFDCVVAVAALIAWSVLALGPVAYDRERHHRAGRLHQYHGDPVFDEPEQALAVESGAITFFQRSSDAGGRTLRLMGRTARLTCDAGGRPGNLLADGSKAYWQDRFPAGRPVRRAWRR